MSTPIPPIPYKTAAAVACTILERARSQCVDTDSDTGDRMVYRLDDAIMNVARWAHGSLSLVDLLDVLSVTSQPIEGFDSITIANRAMLAAWSVIDAARG